MLGKFLGFGRMYENNIFFLFLKRKIDLIFFLFFYNVFSLNSLKKTRYFNTRFVFYSVNIQLDIMQNW